MKLTIKGTSEEIGSVLLTILNSKKHTVSETFLAQFRETQIIRDPWANQAI